MGSTSKLGSLTPQRIVILRALQLGDLLCAVPAFRALRTALPDASISLLGLPWSRAFVQRFSAYLDEFIEFPGFPGFPERPPQVERIPIFLQEMQARGFNLALQMQGSGGISNSIVELFCARQTAGFRLPGAYSPNDSLYLDYPVDEPEVWRHLRLMEFLGFPLQGDELEYPIFPQDWEELHALAAEHGFQTGDYAQNGGYAVVHAGSRGLDRRWPPERFAAAADGLAQRGLQVVLTGTREEQDLVAQVERQMTAPAVNLAGKTSLGSLGALLAGARLLLSNDTGVSHVAAALRTPSVILFSASDPNRWAPKDRRLHRPVPWASYAGPEDVLAEVDELLKLERAHVAP